MDNENKIDILVDSIVEAQRFIDKANEAKERLINDRYASLDAKKWTQQNERVWI